ncbi:MAG: cytochrome P450 [Gemmatimonadota bacterium]|nr:cytochrome P450 [Gemmatimonadota bacterium]
MQHPPGPRGTPVLGTSRRWAPNPLPYMVQLSAEYGSIVRFHFMLDRYGYLVSHPDANQHILQANARNYTKQHPMYKPLSFALGEGLVTADGETWKAHRRQVQPAFHAGRLDALGAMVVRRTEDMLRSWLPALDNDTPIEVDHAMMELTLGVVGEALFGTSLESMTDAVNKSFSRFNQDLPAVALSPLGWLLIRLSFLPSTNKLRRSAAELHTIVDRITASRRAALAAGASPAVPGGDLLAMLLESSDDGSLTDLEIRDEVMTLLLAGHETSATALTWTLYLLDQHPDILENVVDELRGIIVNRSPATSDLKQLPYLRAVVQESMRLYPPLYAFSRMSKEADQFSGFDFPPNAPITMSPYLTHRLPEFWTNPERFDPERFLGDHATSRHKFAYLPFSAGPRQCIGVGFAMTEIMLVLACILPRVRLRAASNSPVEPVGYITLRPRDGLRMKASRRS